MAIFEELYKSRLSLELNNSDTSVLFTSTRRQQAINDAQDNFASLTECLIRTSSIACSCNTSEYNLLSSAVLEHSTDFVRLANAGVEYHLTSSAGQLRTVSGPQFPRRDLDWLNVNSPNWRESTTPVDFPSAYYLRRDGGALYLGLTEPPDVGSSETATILVPYVQRPAPMTSTGDEPFTVSGAARTDLRIYHEALPHYAAYKLLPLVGDLQGAQDHLQTFLGYVTRYLQDQRPKGGTHITPARGYFRDARRVGRSGDASIDADSRWGRRI